MESDDHITEQAMVEINEYVDRDTNTRFTLNTSSNDEPTQCSNLDESRARKQEEKAKNGKINERIHAIEMNDTHTNTTHKHSNIDHWHHVLLSEAKKKKLKLKHDKTDSLKNPINSVAKLQHSVSNCDKAKSETNETNVYKFNATDKPYCIRAFRKVIRTRQSLRLKTGADSCEYDCNDIENADWGEIDGTKYECIVSKVDDDDERKQKLTTICDLKFEKSIFSYDSGVYYSFSSDSSKSEGLRGFMKLDYDSVKNMRFNGECVTLLSVLCGQLTLITETSKHKKIETGYEIEIPHHTSYQLRNVCVEVCYLYFQVTRFGTQLE